MSNQELAQLLATARKNGNQIALTPFESLQSKAQAYEIQTIATELYGSKRTGYKVGATNEATQQIFGCNEPFYGPLFEADSFQPGATFTCNQGLLGGEAEFAFHIGTDVPTDTDLTTQDLKSYISNVHTAVELVGRRTIGDGPPPLHAAIADFGANSAFVQGPEVEQWDTIDLATVAVTAKTNGVETNSGSGSAVMGHPLNSLLWLHNQLRSNGNGLKAGEWIITGTCLGVIAAEPGSVIDIDFSCCPNFTYQLS